MKQYSLEQIKRRFGILGSAPGLNQAIELAVRVAATEMSVLLRGENGSGKESFAKIIHHMSLRKHSRFLAINCGAIPEGTINSELFGHEKGAFTSASEKRKGYFEEADGGTIFLDEIGELPLSAQAKLLRLLENKEYMRVGSSEVRSNDARIVAATNVDLEKQLFKKAFREDLYYRIAQVTITIPPLRERGDDILFLFKKFALDFAEKHHAALIQLTPEAAALLQSYAFPGNIRQLKNITWQIAALEREIPNITEEVLQKYLPKLPALIHLPSTSSSANNSAQHTAPWRSALLAIQKEVETLKKLIWEIAKHYNAHKVHATQESPSLPLLEDNNMRLLTTDTPKASTAQTPNDVAAIKTTSSMAQEKALWSLKEQEQKLIQQAVQESSNHKEAAKKLDISERTLYRKLKEYKKIEKATKISG